MKNLSSLIFSISVLTVSAQSLNDIQFGTDSTFDIVTWNIEWFPKNGAITVDSVSKIITAIDADIIACQEINDTAVFNGMVNALPGFSAVYDPNNFERLAYIYKTDNVQLVDNYSLFTASNFWRPFPRAPYLMNVIYNNETYILINNHLKCCGNGFLNQSDIDDEENRRLAASNLLENYISSSFENSNVILLGDLNDELSDASVHNVFQPFLDANDKYLFTNITIANGSSANWSYPSWPSHLDHILITDELFPIFNHPASSVETIRIDDFLPNGFSDYDTDISDHRPVGLKLFTDALPLNISKTIVSFQSFSVYPNPANTNIFIAFNNIPSNSNFIITNAVGKKVYSNSISENSSESTINISHLKKGIYFCYVEGNQTKIAVKKLVIN